MPPKKRPDEWGRGRQECPRHKTIQNSLFADVDEVEIRGYREVVFGD